MNCGQIKRVLDSSKDKELQLPIHMNMYMVNCMAKARFNFIKQLAIHFGKLDPTKVSDPAFPNDYVSVTREPGKFFCQYFLWGGGGTGVAPCVQQGDTKPIKGGSIPLVINPFFCLYLQIIKKRESE